jgi:hypothetical protein
MHGIRTQGFRSTLVMSYSVKNDILPAFQDLFLVVRATCMSSLPLRVCWMHHELNAGQYGTDKNRCIAILINVAYILFNLATVGGSLPETIRLSRRSLP